MTEGSKRMSELEYLGQKLHQIYSRAKADRTATVKAILFGVEHSKAVACIGSQKIVAAAQSYAERVNEEPIRDSCYRYLNLGVQLSAYVVLGKSESIIDHELSKDLLTEKLTDMYEGGASSREGTMKIVLFCIEYAADLEKLDNEEIQYIANSFEGPERREGSSPNSWVPEIQLGMKLAHRVILKSQQPKEHLIMNEHIGITETGTDDLVATLEGGVLTLKLNRPEARNAMSAEMNRAFAEALAAAELDPEVRCIVVTGAGKGFCAGGDVKGMAGEGGSQGGRGIDAAIHAQRVNQRAISGKLYSMPKPTIAALPGAAAGAGLSIALACDMRIMADNAIMTTAFAHVGFSGDYGGTFFLSQLVGTAKARQLYFLSERISADEALALGLANWVCEPGELAAKTSEIAMQLASGPTIAYRYMKENLNRALSSGDLNDCMDLEATHHVHCGQTQDHKNAVQAFIDKSKPVFQGR